MSANDYYAGGKPQGQYGPPQGQYYPPPGVYDVLHPFAFTGTPFKCRCVWVGLSWTCHIDIESPSCLFLRVRAGPAICAVSQHTNVHNFQDLWPRVTILSSPSRHINKVVLIKVLPKVLPKGILNSHNLAPRRSMYNNNLRKGGELPQLAAWRVWLEFVFVAVPKNFASACSKVVWLFSVITWRMVN
ncbi:hypothetical protein L208DRAFT_1411710 [Tricholoma matsutake]|nr:hypothetical protein L208DRAFT_1411710 [Tricholoma matsutake 945]